MAETPCEKPASNAIVMLTGGTIKVSVHADKVKTVFDTQSDGQLPRCTRRLYFGKTCTQWALMIVNCLMALVGGCSATLLGRLYFVHGGSHRWLYTWIQSVGWPVNLFPLFYCYWWLGVRPTPLTPKLAIVYAGMGCITAFDNLLYSWGLSYLPVSTNSLLCASQLAFNAVFAYALVSRRLTSYMINSVFVITIAAVLLGIYSESDRPKGTTDKEYILGFVATIAASAIYALLLPLMELIYRKMVGKTNFVVVLEAQTSIAVMATVFSMVGMWIDRDFAAIHGEAVNFTLGSGIYTVTLVGSAIGWQFCILGSVGIIFLTSSLMSCVFMTAILPILPILAVIFFHDKFSPLKGISMLLSIWGFISYIYGGYVASKSQNALEAEIHDSQV